MTPRVKALFVVAMLLVIIGCIAGSIILSGEAMAATKKVQQVRIVVTYDGQWSGRYGNESAFLSWSGNGTQSLTVDKGSSYLVANAQKQDDGAGLLTISIQTLDGKILDESSTTEARGMAQVTASF